MFQDRKIRHLIKFTALNYAKEEEWRQARGRKNGKGGHDLYPIIYVPRPIIVAQVRTILRLSVLDHRIRPTFFPVGSLRFT